MESSVLVDAEAKPSSHVPDETCSGMGQQEIPWAPYPEHLCYLFKYLCATYCMVGDKQYANNQTFSSKQPVREEVF